MTKTKDTEKEKPEIMLQVITMSFVSGPGDIPEDLRDSLPKSLEEAMECGGILIELMFPYTKIKLKEGEREAILNLIYQIRNPNINLGNETIETLNQIEIFFEKGKYYDGDSVLELFNIMAQIIASEILETEEKIGNDLVALKERLENHQPTNDFAIILIKEIIQIQKEIATRIADEQQLEVCSGCGHM